MKAAVEFDHVTVKLEHDVVLRDVSVAIPEAKVTGLLGPSGAGKTTLMRVLVGLQRPGSGASRVLGLSAGAAQLRPLVGYVTQAPAVYPDLTVHENLRYFGAMVGAGGARVREVTTRVRLEAQSTQLVGRLSGGQRARVSLAVALLGSPKVLVLDEPTVGLDPVLRQELWEQFHELARAGVTLLVSSHVMDEARRCDNLVLLREGAVLATGTPAQLMGQTDTHDMEAAFLRLVGAAS
ncbi:MAG TPA: ABC transporter ATP-binding protein [Candidatus Saccharimonadia bacterium]|nr:ABC transporter ATP-binding protein [Candidatus Saccharimonadia bacterium]